MKYRVLKATVDHEVNDIITIEGDGYIFDRTPPHSFGLPRYMFVEDAIKLGFLQIYD